MKYYDDVLKWRELVENMDENDEEENNEEEAKPKNGKACKDEDVIEFLKENPNPSDDDVHDWAEEKGFDIHKLESIFYKLATKYVQSMEKEEK